MPTPNLAQYIGRRYKHCVKLSRFFGNLCAGAPVGSSLSKHYLDVALGHANNAALWREAAFDLKAGRLEV